jgi:hypothetical protein
MTLNGTNTVNHMFETALNGSGCSPHLGTHYCRRFHPKGMNEKRENLKS